MVANESAVYTLIDGVAPVEEVQRFSHLRNGNSLYYNKVRHYGTLRRLGNMNRTITARK